MTLETVLSYWSGLAFVNPGLGLPELLGTMLVLHVCDAVMCRLFARNNGYPKRLWTALGFVGGIWAVAILILLPRRPPRRPDAGAPPAAVA
jgi:hypothetical protein